MENMRIYNECKTVPCDAQKPIQAGRLKGKTDINPQWRIEKLTEMFGPCGIGWKVKTINKWIEEGANNEKAVFMDIELFIKVDGEWSEAIEGTGGASFVSKEKNGMYTSDECYKMAKTDALSVACKMIGIGSDIYRGYNDSSKYSGNKNINNTGQNKVTHEQLKRFYAIAKSRGISDISQLEDQIKKAFNLKSKNDWLRNDYSNFCEYMENHSSIEIFEALNKKIQGRFKNE